MPDHIQAEALRYAVIIQVMPTTAISPEGKMSAWTRQQHSYTA